MECGKCRTMNDNDAAFCSECGVALNTGSERPARQRRAYWIALLFVPVVAIAVGIGYYKFFLPDGIVAVVNNEEIRQSELDNAMVRMQNGRASTAAGSRYQALNELIAERLALQEARKAGITVSREEIAAAAARDLRESGLDEAAFRKDVAEVYGSAKNYERSLERRLTVNRLIVEKVVPRGADPLTARQVVNEWLQGLSRTASVRIALAEQMAGPGCSCCSGKGSGAGPTAGGQRPPAPATKTDAATTAGLRYWQEKHGPDAVTASAKDFGCHVQVDIRKNEKIVGSLRYQDGNITEL